MTVQISITNGFYRGNSVNGVFPLIKPWQTGARGGFVTIRNPNPEAGQPPIQRVSCELESTKMLDASGKELAEYVVVDKEDGNIVTSTNYEQVFMQTETEEAAMERIADTFTMLDRIVDSCARGIVRGLVVSGPPGIGKSHGVEKQLDAANLFRKLEGKPPKYEVVSGGVSGIGLYQKLYHNRKKDNVLVFDDCDGVLFDEEMLNMLKNALGSNEKRRISWNKESRVLDNEQIESTFDFEGSIIFLSNIDFEKTIARGSRMSGHLEAIMSRCHYLDLEIGTMRDKLLRIRQVVRDGMLANYHFTQDQQQMVLDFINDNAEYLREVSLRMVKKVADFVKSDPDNWLGMAEATCLQREARFKRLLNKKKEALRVGVELCEE